MNMVDMNMVQNDAAPVGAPEPIQRGHWAGSRQWRHCGQRGRCRQPSCTGANQQHSQDTSASEKRFR